MKRLNWSVFLFLISLSLTAQQRADYGIMGGISSYLGDINPNRLLYSPKPAGGFFYRFNFNPRQALRADVLLGGLRGNDLDFNNSFQQTRGRSFSGFFGEAAIQFEFNFFPYSTDGKRLDYTPYLAAGAGVTYCMTVGQEILPVIPFSIGFKINILKNMGLEAEYGFRKTFYDNFDGLKDFVDPADYSTIHNHDWYSFTGISLTWKLMGKMAGCPAYGDADSGRRR